MMASMLEIKNTFVFEREYCECDPAAPPCLTRSVTEPIRCHLPALIRDEDSETDFKPSSEETLEVPTPPLGDSMSFDSQAEGHDSICSTPTRTAFHGTFFMSADNENIPGRKEGPARFCTTGQTTLQQHFAECEQPEEDSQQEIVQQPLLRRMQTFDPMEDGPWSSHHNDDIDSSISGPGQPLPRLMPEHRLRTYDHMEDGDVNASCSNNNDSSNSNNYQSYYGYYSSSCYNPIFLSTFESSEGSEERVHEAPSAPTNDAEVPPRTTLMLRNIPRCYNRDMLVDLLEREGFGDSWDFLYFPYKFEVGSPEGYAFVNIVSKEATPRFAKHFTNFSAWGVPCKRKCTIGWSRDAMGLEANIQRYRNSPVMHSRVPEHWKPLRRRNGITIPFELPTKSIKLPRKGTKLVRFESS